MYVQGAVPCFRVVGSIARDPTSTKACSRPCSACARSCPPRPAQLQIQTMQTMPCRPPFLPWNLGSEKKHLACPLIHDSPVQAPISFQLGS
jgi:hypothetical protein